MFPPLSDALANLCVDFDGYFFFKKLIGCFFIMRRGVGRKRRGRAL